MSCDAQLSIQQKAFYSSILTKKQVHVTKLKVEILNKLVPF